VIRDSQPVKNLRCRAQPIEGTELAWPSIETGMETHTYSPDLNFPRLIP
jgi:hypothetical protein